MATDGPLQDLRSPDGDVNWVLKQQVERDICLLFHQLADYPYVMGDLYYGSVFDRPYWMYLDWAGLDANDRAFIRDGCLVMILAMAWGQIDGAVGMADRDISVCRAAIDRLTCENSDTETLVRTVRLALETAERREAETPELCQLSGWVHTRYVREYFRRRVREFDKPYFQGSTESGFEGGANPET